METQGVPAQRRRDHRSADGVAEAQSLFLDQLDAIEAITQKVARRWRFREDRARDFDGQVKLHLIQKDYLVLRSYRGGSQLSTYLTRVINNLARDFRARQVGRYRPSRSAQRLGADAIELERLIYHEGWGHEEALEILRQSRTSTASRTRQEEMLAQLPARTQKRPVPLDDLGASEVSAPATEPPEEIELSELRAQVRSCLSRVEVELPLADQLLLHLRFTEGLTVAEIARRKKMDQRELYGRFGKILDRFRCCFEKSELSWSQVSALLGWDTSTRPPTEALGRTAPGSDH